MLYRLYVKSSPICANKFTLTLYCTITSAYNLGTNNVRVPKELLLGKDH